jgi:hypothetical protein
VASRLASIGLEARGRSRPAGRRGAAAPDRRPRRRAGGCATSRRRSGFDRRCGRARRRPWSWPGRRCHHGRGQQPDGDDLDDPEAAHALGEQADMLMRPPPRPEPRCARRRAAWPSGRADWRPARPRSARWPCWRSARNWRRGLGDRRGMARAAGDLARTARPGRLLTMRSSSEWKVTTARRPPGFRIRLGGGEPGLDLGQLLVHRDAQGLEGRWRGGSWRPCARRRARSTASARSRVRSNGRSARRRTSHLAMRRLSRSSP